MQGLLNGRLFGLVTLIVVLSACGNGDSMESFGGPTMGSTYSIKYVRRAGLPAAADVRVEVEKILADIDRQLSTYRSDSDIERFNDLPANRCQKMPASILKLIRVGEQLSEQSEGSYDLTVEPLLNLWGFGPQGARKKSRLNRRWRRRVSESVINTCVSRAISCARTLPSRSTSTALPPVTRSIRLPHDSKRWASRLPGRSHWRTQGRGQEATVRRGASPWKNLATINRWPSDHRRRRFRLVHLRRLSKLFRAGWPALLPHLRCPHRCAGLTSLASVTVIHPSALMADGLSTLLLILGPERGWDYAENTISAHFW
jgi:thiamine biosynthesis lipoprotein